jgi:hypothetical protein
VLARDGVQRDERQGVSGEQTTLSARHRYVERLVDLL